MPGFVIEGYCFIKPCLAHPFPFINRHFFAEHRFSPFLYRLHIHLDGRKHKFRPGEYASSIELGIYRDRYYQHTLAIHFFRSTPKPFGLK